MGVGTGCAGSQPAIVDSFNLVATIPKALFKKGVAAFEPFISPDFDICDLHNMFTCDVVCELLYFVANTSTSSNKKTRLPLMFNTQSKPWRVDKL